jgi:imidazoleglycerol-phosphate dehydratase/histidinol-phosphatase
MLTRYLAQGIDLASSFVIGDRITDLQMAKNLGCGAIYFNGKPDPLAIFNSNDWNDIYNFLKSRPRLAIVTRSTKETSIELQINLDGSGKCNITTGIGFFDHMLEQIPRHGGFDITLRAKGDLNVDQHHTIEDVAIALGEGILSALGSKKGIERYGYLLPMDDSIAQTAIDFGGRPWFIWDVPLSGPAVGGVPSEMFFHFFKSFSDSAKCNLNIIASGDNDHHKVEAVFKSFARAVKSAVRKTGNYDLPSTKGTL